MKKFAKTLAVCAVFLCLSAVIFCLGSCGKDGKEAWNIKTLSWLKDKGVTTVSVVETESLEGLDSSYNEKNDYLEVTLKGEMPSEFGNLYVKDLVNTKQWVLVDAKTEVSEKGYSSYTLFSDGSEGSGKSVKCVAKIYAEDNILNEAPRLVLNFSVNQLLSGESAQERITSFTNELGFTKCFYGDGKLSDIADWFMVDKENGTNTLLVTAIDFKATAESSLLEIIDTQHFTIDQSSVDFHGTFIRGNEKNDKGNVATSKSFGNYGVYYMYINEDVPYYNWPAQKISGFVEGEGFETKIPSLEGLFTIEQNSTSIIFRALDGKMHGYTGSLDKIYYDLIQADGKWTIEEVNKKIDSDKKDVTIVDNDEEDNVKDVTMYEACSIEVIERQCVHIIFGNVGHLKQFYLEIKIDEAIGLFPSELVAELVNETWGFETEVPTPEGDKWNCKSNSEPIELYTKKVDANSYYKYLINFSDSKWKIENGTRQTTGGKTIPAATCFSLETIEDDETEYAIKVFFYQIELDEFKVQVTVDVAPGQFNLKAIKNIFNDGFGFTTTVPTADGDSWQPSDDWCSDVEYMQYTEDFELEDLNKYIDKFDVDLWNIDVIETVAYGFYQTIGRCVSKETINIGGQDMVMKVVTTLVEDVEFNVDVYLINEKAEFDSDAVNNFVKGTWGFNVDVPIPSGDSWYYHEEDATYYWQYTNKVDDNTFSDYLSKFDSESWNVTKPSENTADCISKKTSNIDGVNYEIWVHILLTSGSSMDVTVNIQEHRVLFPTYEINEKLVEQGWDETCRLTLGKLNALGAVFYGLEIESENDTYIITVLSDEDMAIPLDMLILDDYDGGKPFTDQFEDRKYESYGIISYYPCYFDGDGNIDETKPWVEIVCDPHQMFDGAVTTITFTIPKATK